MKPTRARLPDGPYFGEGWAGMAIDGFLTRSVRDQAILLDGTQGADPGAPYWAPPLRGTFLDAIERRPDPLRIALCDTCFTGEPVHPVCRQAVHDAAALLEDMGHHVVPARPAEADTAGMMRAWTDIVACGAALSVRRSVAARGRPLEDNEVEGVTRGAIAHAATVSGDRYLECVNIVHAYGRSMAEFLTGYDILLSPTMAEPPALVGRFSHKTEDYLSYRTGPNGVFAYSPFTAAFNASGQPAVSVPLYWSPEGLPIGVHLAARFGEDELLISLCAELERARPWFDRRPPISA
jgi:amidase/6-aminohexanoate-cyclic-dimer hydrolase